MAACPTPVRAAENWLEPRDREGGKRENQIWIIAQKLAHAKLTSSCEFIGRIYAERRSNVRA